MSGYIGPSPVPQATQHREAFTATASQTSFPTVGYTPQFVDVYLNGVKLAAADYTATNGSDIVLTTGAALNDILEYVAYTPFEVASQTFTGTTTTDVLTATGAFTSLGIDDNATSTAMTLDASGNVGIGGNLTIDPNANISGKSDNTGFVSVFGGGAYNAGAGIGLGGSGNATANAVVFTRGAYSESMRIDASGSVGIGTSAPSAKLDVSGSANGVLRLKHNYSYSQPNWAIKIDGEVGTPAGYLSQSGASGGFFLASGGVYYGGGSYKADANATSFCSIQAAADTITFRNASGLTGGQVFSGAETMRIDASGALLHGTTTAGSAGAGDIVANGGVYLGGTAAANKLDDYEGGTFTPAISGLSVTGSPTYSYRSGWYVKIGDLVTVGVQVDLSALGGVSGELRISGLPFAAAAAFNTNTNVGALRLNGVNTAPNNFCVIVLGGVTQVAVRTTNTNSDASLLGSNLTNTSGIGFQVSYRVA